MPAQPDLGIGARLASARQRARLTVIQAAERLHVDPLVIEALEAERFEEFGASVYARGHIRRYAELLGEQAAELQALYATSAHAARTPDLTQVPQGESRVEASRALLVPAVIVVAAVAVIGTVWWVAGTFRAASRSQRPGVAPAAQLAPGAPGASPARAGTERFPGAAQGGATAAQTPSTGSQPASIASQPASAAVRESTPVHRSATPQDGGTAALRMQFGQDSWAEVYDARGKRLFYDVGSADSTRTVSGTPPLRVVLGNPAGVSLQLDGRPVSIPGSVERGVRVEFQIARSGRAVPSHLAAASRRSASATGVQAP